ncbi:hypothetical protein [Burkholderia ubonensis]|uniref:hypothetical protein n=1 Tax=Burkholderia ubonensis TaxID=101571 RepID=UPI0018DEF34E|nr:hypothetical protein [Burkholderia ubonensis]
MKADDEMAASLPTETLQRDFERALITNQPFSNRLHSALKIGFNFKPNYEIATTCLHEDPVDG